MPDDSLVIDPPASNGPATVLTRTGPRVDRIGNLVPVINEPGRVAQVDKWLLSVDPAYQRLRLNMARVLRIAANWSWVKCGVLRASEREDGHIFVFDGQHRLEGAKRVAWIKHLPCIIFPLGSVTEEAIGFLACNADRKIPTLAEQYRALILAGDPQAISAGRFAELAGRRLSAPSGPHTISCVSDLMRAIQADEAALERVWPLITELCHQQAMTARIVRAVHSLERRMPEGTSLMDKLYYDRVLRLGVHDILQSIKVWVMAEGNAGERTCAEGLCVAVNKGLKTARLDIDWSRRLGTPI
jgi:hypothetical protein